MRLIRAKLKDDIYVVGLAFLVLSIITFFIPDVTGGHGEILMFCTFGNAVFSYSYFLILLFGKRITKKKKGRGVRGVFLVLFLISAYSLNREMYVFENSADWLCVLLVISCINYLLFPFRGGFPVWALYLQHFILGVSLCCFIYLAVYLAPFYVISVIVSFVLGISLHVFVPILFVIYTLLLFRKTYKQRGVRLAFYSGAGTAVTIISAFCITWGITVGRMNRLSSDTRLAVSTGLPAWVTAAQKIPHNFVTRKILKSDIIYTVPNALTGNFWWRQPSTHLEEKKTHDPLVMTAALLCGQPDINWNDRINVLKAMYDSRSQAEERNWAGDMLYTSHVHTAVFIWQDLHIAYTEKILDINNDLDNSFWRNDLQEAIYTFHLPEGAVVSALSLWINGREEKGILTTKAKADSAYNTIVGFSRDPSVVHWQEGNRVTVRVFPVSKQESRKCKIGITSPLLKEDDRLIYRNVYFDGPSTSRTWEDVQVEFVDVPEQLVTTGAFDQYKKKLEKRGGYEAGWQLSVKDPGIRSNVFGANGQVYTINACKQQRTATNYQQVYLDVNSAWTAKEFEDLLAIFNTQKIWVAADGQLVQVTDRNKTALFSKLNSNQFSLFPLQLINDPLQSLLVTKGTINSPNLSDLEGSAFLDGLRQYLANPHKVLLFNMGGELSPYMKSLKEARAFRYEQGDVALLTKLSASHLFAADMENEKQVVITSAGISIHAEKGTCVNAAPDHLARLFSYNHIMQQMSARLLNELPEGDTLVAAAKEANIVTPFSSLVVLETAEDYQRFNIQDSENSLKNATLNSTGAVPEPHEWGLIILVLLTLIYVKYRSSKIQPGI